MENKYRKTLLDLNFNINSVGFEYWLKAIELYKKDNYKYMFDMMILYSEIAKLYNTTWSRVERALRFSSVDAKLNIHGYYNYYGKITNKTILKLIATN